MASETISERPFVRSAQRTVLRPAVTTVALALLVFIWVPQLDAPEEGALLRVSYGAILLGLGASDLRRRVIPNAVVYPALIAVLVVALPEPGVSFRGSVGGALVGSLPFLVMFGVAPRSIGGGDVKMAALMGAMAAWPGALIALLLATLSGAVAAALFLASGKRSSRLAYGPFLALGGLGSLLFA